MPYRLRDQGTQTCVIKATSGKAVPGGCHPTRKKATAHMQALNINVHKLPVKKNTPKHSSRKKKDNPHNEKQRSGNSSPDYKWKGR